jgi:hypothetical protein
MGAHKSLKSEMAENVEQVVHNGKKIPLKSDRLKAAFKKVESQVAGISELEIQIQAKKLEGKEQELIGRYQDMMNVLDDAQVVVKKERAEEQKKSEQSGQLYNVLLQYIARLKLKSSVSRNILQAQLVQKKLKIDAIFATHKQGSIGNSGVVRAQNIVRFYEKAIKA